MVDFSSFMAQPSFRNPVLIFYTVPQWVNTRQLFSQIAQQPEVDIAYVSGGHREQVEATITELHILQPDYILGNVSNSIYQIKDHQWQQWPD